MPRTVFGYIQYSHTVLEKLAEERDEDRTTKKSTISIIMQVIVTAVSSYIVL